jgi:UV DNA damage endonuclease
MKIGYPCINLSLTCRSSKTFRLASYTEERLHETIKSNLHCLQEILSYNVEHGLLFFRISSKLIPFGSHPVNTYPWEQVFREDFIQIGRFIKTNHVRISMHPDQFALINSPSEAIFKSTVRELVYHVAVLNAMQLDDDAKIQIHVGGAYGDKETSSMRFIQRYKLLPLQVKKRLVIENDDRLFSLKDCLKIHQYTSIPVLFDNLHHALNNNGESVREALSACKKTWREIDGLPMTDYSEQEKGGRIGKHAQTLDTDLFKNYINQTARIDFDIMLEIKDKEQSALRALQILE